MSYTVGPLVDSYGVEGQNKVAVPSYRVRSYWDTPYQRKLRLYKPYAFRKRVVAQSTMGERAYLVPKSLMANPAARKIVTRAKRRAAAKSYLYYRRNDNRFPPPEAFGSVSGKCVKEIKRKQIYHYSSGANTLVQTFTTTPSWSAITDVTQGDAYNERVGNRIFIRHIRVSWNVAPDAAVDASSTVVNRLTIAIVCDKHGTGTAPTATQVFGATAPLLAFKNPDPDNSSRFVILMQRYVELGHMVQTGVPGTSGTIWSTAAPIYRHDKFYWKFKEPLAVSFASGGTAAANSLWLMVVAGAATSANNPTLQILSEITYTD